MTLDSFKSTYLFLFFLISIPFISCTQAQQNKGTQEGITPQPGANNTSAYLPLLKGKKIAIVANQTSRIEVRERAEVAPNIMGSRLVNYHLVDYLYNYNTITVSKVFAPEHGFRGTADAGEVIKDGRDTKTGLPIISLYGKNKKPTPKQLKGIDVVVFDIQDVGARFYTYISTLHYVMEACAEANIPVILLDRPNPNGHYIDGPILEKEHQSFVGMHPVPMVYGMTIGEYGKMINGEAWLKNGISCTLTVVPNQHYTHQSSYTLPVKPSPNLPNAQAINLYPSLCLFEGTNISVGRGTAQQFQVVGTPFFNLSKQPYEFTPQPNEGSKYPKHEGKLCYGFDLTDNPKLSKITLEWLITFYAANKEFAPKEPFFNAFFTKLAGTEQLQQQIEMGLTENAIRASWAAGLDNFKKIRGKYLLYD